MQSAMVQSKGTINAGLLSEVFGYGDNIISQVPKFKDFCIACVDHIGKQSIPYIKCAYSGLRHLVPGYIADKMDSHVLLDNVTESEIIEWYMAFKEDEQKRAIEKEFKDNIDELQFLVEEYRKSDDFQKMLDFIGRFKWLAPYNAMLVQMQLPGARLVLNGKNWAAFNRRPKKNAKRLITLMNFGPIQCMFEYGDTEHIPGTEEISEDAIFEKWDKMLISTSGEPSKDDLDNLLWNLAQLGICLDTNFVAANTYGGYLSHYSEGEVKFHLADKCTARAKSAFIISVNGRESNASQFQTLCHELGHLFCKHLYYDRSKERRPSVQQREFEAETVAWLVCKRRGIKNPSEPYLSTYAPDGIIPVCSTEMIMKAVTKIEALLSSKMNIKSSPWFEKNKALRELVECLESERRQSRNLFDY